MALSTIPNYDEKERKRALKYIRDVYPQVYGTKTVLEITPHLTDAEKEDPSVERNLASIACHYRFQFPPNYKEPDSREPHYRCLTSDCLMMMWEKPEDKPQNINRFALKRGQSKSFPIDLSTVQGHLTLAFWLEHPLVKIYGIENPFCTSSPIYEMRIRGNVIKHDFELVNENYAIGQEILAIVPDKEASEEEKKTAAIELTNLASFIGMDTVGLTQAELIIGLLGKKMDGKAYQERAKYRRYQALNNDERDLEIALSKAIEYKFIQDTGVEGWKMDDGTLLGGDRSQALNYLREKRAAFNKLMERVRIHGDKTPSISDVEELVSEPSENVRQNKPLRPAKKTVVEA